LISSEIIWIHFSSRLLERPVFTFAYILFLNFIIAMKYLTNKLNFDKYSKINFSIENKAVFGCWHTILIRILCIILSLHEHWSFVRVLFLLKLEINETNIWILVHLLTAAVSQIQNFGDLQHLSLQLRHLLGRDVSVGAGDLHAEYLHIIYFRRKIDGGVRAWFIVSILPSIAVVSPPIHFVQ
jgi:hypothetical protein